MSCPKLLIGNKNSQYGCACGVINGLMTTPTYLVPFSLQVTVTCSKLLRRYSILFSKPCLNMYTMCSSCITLLGRLFYTVDPRISGYLRPLPTKSELVRFNGRASK